MNVASHKVRPPLHPAERWLLGIVSVHLVFAAWAFGTMHGWSQLTSLGLSVLSLGVALWPRRYDEEQTEGRPFLMRTWPRLMRFPLFWLGLLLLGYLILQALNPSWVWERNAKQWWMRKIPDQAWLPTSTDTPFERFNLWRQFIIYASAWLTVCALWIGITRRRSLQILLTLLVTNAVVISVLGIVLRLQGSTRTLGIRQFKGSIGFGSFVYHNHGAAYVALIALVALALAAWFHTESRRRMARSSPALVWGIVTALLGLAVAYSTSRAGLGLLLIFVLLAGIAYLIAKPAQSVPSTTPPVVVALLAAMVLGTVGFAVLESDLSGLTQKVVRLTKEGAHEESYRGRVLVRERAVRMLGDHWVRGTGAGSFRFLFPVYISDSHFLYEGGQAFWEHAHIDWLEIPIEQGAAGTALIAAAFGWCVLRWFRQRGWRHPVALMLMLGCLQTLAHALIDFPFQCPAILLTWWVLLISALRWLEFDGERR